MLFLQSPPITQENVLVFVGGLLQVLVIALLTFLAKSVLAIIDKMTALKAQADTQDKQLASIKDNQNEILEQQREQTVSIDRLNTTLFGVEGSGVGGVAFHVDRSRGRIHDLASWVMHLDVELDDLFGHLKIPRRNRRATDPKGPDSKPNE